MAARRTSLWLGIASALLAIGFALWFLPGRSAATSSAAETSGAVPLESPGDRTSPAGSRYRLQSAPAKPRSFTIAVPDTGARAALEPPANADDARTWVRSHLESALLWLVGAPPGPARDVVLEIACFELAQYRPQEAAALADRYGGGRMDLLENIVHQWTARDAAAAEAYALSKPPGEMRNRLLSRVASERARKEPVEAAKLAIEQIAPGGIRNETFIAVLKKWIERDKDAATEWALAIPEGKLRERAIREVAGAMAYAEE